MYPTTTTTTTLQLPEWVWVSVTTYRYSIVIVMRVTVLVRVGVRVKCRVGVRVKCRVIMVRSRVRGVSNPQQLGSWLGSVLGLTLELGLFGINGMNAVRVIQVCWDKCHSIVAILSKC